MASDADGNPLGYGIRALMTSAVRPRALDLPIGRSSDQTEDDPIQPRHAPGALPPDRVQLTGGLPGPALRPQPRPLDRTPEPVRVPEQPVPALPADTNDERAADGASDDGSWELIQRAQAGDREAFAQLYERYVDVVFRYVYYRIGNRTQAEDFTSETFLRALRRIGTFTWTGRDIGAWFVTIARNLVFDHAKSSRYRSEISTPNMLDQDRAEEGPENAVIERVSNAELYRCVWKLSAEQRECIVLRFMQGLSVAETAAVMRKNDGAIKALQHRAIRRLASLLPDHL